MSSWGIRVLDNDAVGSTNVLDADDADLTFTTKYNFLKQYLVGQVNLTLSGVGATDSATISHGLGYVPYIEAFYKPSTAHDILSPTYSFYGTDYNDQVDYIEGYVEVNNSQVTVSASRNEAFSSTGTSTITVPFYYLIYVDEL